MGHSHRLCGNERKHSPTPTSVKCSRKVVEVLLAVMEILVEEETMVVEVVGAEHVIEMMVDIMDLEVMVETMVVVLVIVAEEAMVVVDQDMETKGDGRGGGGRNDDSMN